MSFACPHGLAAARGVSSVLRTRTCPLPTPGWGPSYRRARNNVSLASLLPKDAIVKQTQARGVSNETVDRVLSKASAALRDWTAVTTEFLTPPDAASLCDALGNVADLRVEVWGGFSSAERTVLVLARNDVAETLDEGNVFELVKDDLVPIQINGNFLFDIASHPDFLGSILGSGISRQKVGDIIVIGDRGAQVIVSADVVEYLRSAVSSVRSVSVEVESIPWEALQVRPPSVKEMTVVEASMRLDAVASAGFGMSRSKLADLVKGGACQRNYVVVTQPSKALQSGDVISVRGKGKLEVGETSITAKKRFRINLKRFV